MSSTEFVVTGMVCSGCSGTVEKLAAGVAGVSAASADAKTGSLTVSHDGSANLDAVQEAVRGGGFGVRACGSAGCQCANCNCDPCQCASADACS